ncbi:MAG: hypothetical protein ACHWZW_02725 [Spirulina sp.]
MPQVNSKVVDLHPHISAAPDIGSESDDVLMLSPSDLKEAWTYGILNDTAYLFWVLKFEFAHAWRDRVQRNENNTMVPFSMELNGADIDYLRQKWRGEYPIDKDGNLKTLSVDAIFKALATFDKKGAAFPRAQQLTLFMATDTPLLSGDHR